MTKFEVVTAEVPERAVLIGVDRGSLSWPLEESLSELERLVETAGACVVATMSQRMSAPNPKTFIGSGKATELVRMVEHMDANLVVFDDELTPSQQTSLERMVGKNVKVIDRTALILDIFALHATSKEGRLQVRLAQNQYLYPRLRGMWSHLASNRMGGGVGSRFGEGESQLEVDRRLIRKRIGRIRAELKDLAASRTTQRKKRKGSGIFRIALAGYTNAGKSSLLNRLTKAGVLADDKLFATLDSTTRRLELGDGRKATLTDTVGFIQKLPHDLVEAFRSTLDEVSEADLILQVTDAASDQRDAQIAAVQEVLCDIGASDIPVQLIFNKSDLVDSTERLQQLYPDALFISARTGEGITALQGRLAEALDERDPVIEALIPFAQGRLVQKAHDLAYVIEETYEEEGTRIKMRVPDDLMSAYTDYLI